MKFYNAFLRREPSPQSQIAKLPHRWINTIYCLYVELIGMLNSLFTEDNDLVRSKSSLRGSNILLIDLLLLSVLLRVSPSTYGFILDELHCVVLLAKWERHSPSFARTSSVPGLHPLKQFKRISLSYWVYLLVRVCVQLSI